MSKITIITGQTATGKTEFAIQKAVETNGELINSDSRQIYKYLDIISGKDLTHHDYHEEKKQHTFSIGYYPISSSNTALQSALKETKIWLYDIVSPKDYFSSFDYQTCAVDITKKLLENGKNPIIVGGTYFYLYHLLYDVETENIPPNWELRNSLQNAPVEDLQQKLQEVNSRLYASLNESEKNNPQRLIRKIEISLVNKEFSQDTLQTKITLAKKLQEDIEIEYLGFQYKDKDSEMKSIQERVDKRMKEGAVEEVESLLAKGYTDNDPGMKTIGYQQMIKYIRGFYSKEDMLQDWLQKEMQYAKRQFIFMKRDPNINWKTV